MPYNATQQDPRELQPLASVVAVPNALGTDVVIGGTGANAQVQVALAAVAGKTNYVTGLIITGSGATAGLDVVATLAGLIGGITLSFVIAVPTGALLGITPLVFMFPRPIPANAINAAITLTVPAFGVGNTNAAAALLGFTV